MNNEEVNKIIYDYMGHEDDGCYSCGYDGLWEPGEEYCNSLDSLVPVISKIGGGNQVVCFFLGIIKNAKSEIMRNPELTLQQAAAHATAKRIQELER